MASFESFFLFGIKPFSVESSFLLWTLLLPRAFFVSESFFLSLIFFCSSKITTEKPKVVTSDFEVIYQGTKGDVAWVFFNTNYSDKLETFKLVLEDGQWKEDRIKLKGRRGLFAANSFIWLVECKLSIYFRLSIFNFSYYSFSISQVKKFGGLVNMFKFD